MYQAILSESNVGLTKIVPLLNNTLCSSDENNNLFKENSVLDIDAQQAVKKSKKHAVSELPKWQLHSSQFHINRR